MEDDEQVQQHTADLQTQASFAEPIIEQ